MDLLEKLKQEAEGHVYVFIDVSDPRKPGCKHPSHMGMLPICWKAEVTLWMSDHPDQIDETPPRSTDGLAQEMMKIVNDGEEALLVKYIFYGEGVNNDGDRVMFTAATDNMAPWDELGLLEFVKAKVVGRMSGLG